MSWQALLAPTPIGDVYNVKLPLIPAGVPKRSVRALEDDEGQIDLPLVPSIGVGGPPQTAYDIAKRSCWDVSKVREAVVSDIAAAGRTEIVPRNPRLLLEFINGTARVDELPDTYRPPFPANIIRSLWKSSVPQMPDWALPALVYTSLAVIGVSAVYALGKSQYAFGVIAAAALATMWSTKKKESPTLAPAVKGPATDMIRVATGDPDIFQHLCHARLLTVKGKMDVFVHRDPQFAPWFFFNEDPATVLLGALYGNYEEGPYLVAPRLDLVPREALFELLNTREDIQVTLIDPINTTMTAMKVLSSEMIKLLSEDVDGLWGMVSQDKEGKLTFVSQNVEDEDDEQSVTEQIAKNAAVAGVGWAGGQWIFGTVAAAATGAVAFAKKILLFRRQGAVAP